jgi:general secretion pathway protein F
MKFELTVAPRHGVPHLLQIDAASRQEAIAQAELSHGAVLACRPLGAASGLVASRGRQHPLDVLVFGEQMRDLLLAGLSLVESLQAMRRGARGEAARALARIEEQLAGGMTLSAALAADPQFPPLLVALVQASERTSNLPDTLARYLAHAQRVQELRHRLISTAIYPVLLAGVGGLVLGFLLLYVMPRFARVFEGMTGELPWSAQAMLAWSQGLRAHGSWVLLLIAAALAGLAVAAATKSVRARAATAVLNWGPIKARLLPYLLSQWYRTTGMLVLGGIPLPEAIRLSNQLLPTSLRQGADAVLRSVEQGHSPSSAYLRHGMATPVAEQLVLAGERTGDLGTVLQKIAQFHEAESSRALERAMRVFEPVVMVFIGLCVGLVVVLMYLPIFELAGSLS